MRYLTLGAIALAATLGVSGLARAADDLSREEADAQAEAAVQSPYEQAGHALGYSESRWQGHPLATSRAHAAANAQLSADSEFLRLGDRGIGGE
ncbi:hypothetical protein EZH22_24925 [Xanthobacter dioxanivorans]|uniref:Uncharacterized protein n=1 Tax=Xanthobacter dioxanivorans TaxID=2528964 RepID=A0A974PMS3_9HYPH|nr:hypothetical protein [Xanthobacter dioxanivorans]QRG06186.1 hypothetical protein EZH22_24925 [Xanthobacter dioxanivorans]